MKAVTFAFSWSSLGPTVLIIWQRHSRSSPISLSWTLFFFSRSFRAETRENCHVICNGSILWFILQIRTPELKDKIIKHTKKNPYCLDAFMKDRFMDEVEFAKFPDEFNVAKHLDLGNGTLLLLLRSKRVVMFVIDWGEKIIRGKQQKGYVTNYTTRTSWEIHKDKRPYFQHFWCGSQIHLEAWKSAVFWRSTKTRQNPMFEQLKKTNSRHFHKG